MNSRPARLRRAGRVPRRRVQAQILSVLRSAHAELGTSMLFVTHDLGVVATGDGDVVVMLQGEIVERGSTEAVLDDPQHEYTKHLLLALDFAVRPGA